MVVELLAAPQTPEQGVSRLSDFLRRVAPGKDGFQASVGIVQRQAVEQALLVSAQRLEAAQKIGFLGRQSIEFLSIASRPSLDLSDGQFTLAAWVNPKPQPEPVDPACNFETGFIMASIRYKSGCVDWDGWMDPDKGLMLDATTPSGGYTRYFSGTFDFPAGYYDFTVRSTNQGKARVYVDGVQIASADPWEDNASYVEYWDRTASNLHYYLSAGLSFAY